MRKRSFLRTCLALIALWLLAGAAAFSGCGKDRERCVSCPDPEPLPCNAMTRAYDACSLAPQGLARQSALTACEDPEKATFWECAGACYELYADCDRWRDCLDYCQGQTLDDDDDTATDDDSWIDDDSWGADDDDDSWSTDDDDTAPPTDCASAYQFLYNDCGFVLTDENGDEIPLDNAIAACEAGDELYVNIENCLIDLAPDCDAIFECIVALFEGGRQ